ncbi:hypothetical protein [Candidatus Liberibacter asiaticus]|uniref:hypothetical protein n=1 Tax=Liberibacter asiaticus TaxID=34021 RepID=UPI0040597536
MAKKTTNQWLGEGLSSVFSGASTGLMTANPWGVLGGAVIGAGKTFVDYLFSGDEDEDKKEESIVAQPAYTLTKEEQEREGLWMDKHTYSRSKRRSSLFSGLYSGGYS